MHCTVQCVQCVGGPCCIKILRTLRFRSRIMSKQRPIMSAAMSLQACAKPHYLIFQCFSPKDISPETTNMKTPPPQSPPPPRQQLMGACALYLLDKVAWAHPSSETCCKELRFAIRRSCQNCHWMMLEEASWKRWTPKNAGNNALCYNTFSYALTLLDLKLKYFWFSKQSWKYVKLFTE